jgi:hypothetical protein
MNDEIQSTFELAKTTLEKKLGKRLNEAEIKLLKSLIAKGYTGEILINKVMNTINKPKENPTSPSQTL